MKTWLDYWYKPYNPNDVEFNETARRLAEEAREDITEEWACTPKTIATICEVY